jgi:hypothetical protein
MPVYHALLNTQKLLDQSSIRVQGVQTFLGLSGIAPAHRGKIRLYLGVNSSAGRAELWAYNPALSLQMRRRRVEAELYPIGASRNRDVSLLKRAASAGIYGWLARRRLRHLRH